MTRITLRLSVFAAIGLFVSFGVKASAMFSYDAAGRVTSALYDNGLCISYAYDANGNRTAQVNTNAAGPLTPVWGTGTFGCFNWTP
jgi:YD repeat-containing protein